MGKLAFNDTDIRKEVTKLVFYLLSNSDQSLMDLKIEVLQQMNKVVKTKVHSDMEPNLLDCLVLHTIVVNEEQAKAIQESTQKSTQLHD